MLPLPFSSATSQEGKPRSSSAGLAPPVAGTAAVLAEAMSAVAAGEPFAAAAVVDAIAVELAEAEARAAPVDPE